MYRTSRRNVVVVRLIALVAVIVMACQSAEAQDKPFKVTGEGNAPDGLSIAGLVLPYTNSGRATQLGKYSGFGIAQVTGMDAVPTDPHAAFTGSFTGGFVFVSANGDRLVCNHPGTFAVYPDGLGGFFTIFDAIFTPGKLIIPDLGKFKSTGRFKDAEGSFRMIAVTSSLTIDFEALVTSPFDFEWNGKGTLEFEGNRSGSR